MRFRPLLLVIVVLVAGACGDDDASSGSVPPSAAAQGFVGSVDGTDAFITVVVSDTNAAVYACNGDEEIAEYFWGKVDDPSSFSLASGTGGSVDAVFAAGTFSGTLTLPDGTDHEFATDAAVGDAGVYVVVGEQAVDAGIAAGWILDNDGNERGALLRRGRFQPTPRFNRRGITVESKPIAMTRLVSTSATVTASAIIAPNNVLAPADIIAPNNLLRIPAPGGPIPIPFPNIAVTTTTTTTTTSSVN